MLTNYCQSDRTSTNKKLNIQDIISLGDAVIRYVGHWGAMGKVAGQWVI